MAVQDDVRAAATQFGVDPAFALRIAGVESGNDPSATSPKGARGVMQVMPETAKSLAPRYGNDNITQGVGYLKDLQEMFADVPDAQRPHFVAAAYNAGPTRIVQLMEKARKGGQDPYNIASLADHLPEETLNYLVKVNEPLQGATAQATRALRPSPTTPSARTLAPPGSLARVEQARQTPLPASINDVGDTALARMGEGQQQMAANLPGNLRRGEESAESSLRDYADLMRGTPEAQETTIPQRLGIAGRALMETGVAPTLGVAGLTKVAGPVARLLSPTLRARGAAEAERAAQLAAQGGKVAQAEAALPTAQLQNLGAGVGQAGQLAAREEGGAQAQQVAGNIIKRVQGEPPTPSPIVGPKGEPLPATAKDFTDAYKALGEQNKGVATTMRDFDNQVSKLAKAGPAETSTLIARDQDLQRALLTHASPVEATLLESAVKAGQPLAQMPYTADQIRQLGQDIISGKGVMSQLMSQAILPSVQRSGVTARDIAGVVARHTVAASGLAHMFGLKGVVGGELALLVGRLGLKTMDAVISSTAGRAALKSLAAATPGSAYVTAATGTAVANTFGRRLQRR